MVFFTISLLYPTLQALTKTTAPACYDTSPFIRLAKLSQAKTIEVRGQV